MKEIGMEKQANVSRIGLEFADEMKKQSQRERFISLAPFGILLLLIVVFPLSRRDSFLSQTFAIC